MATNKEYLNFILDQLSRLDGITAKQMMGEYIIYYHGRTAAHLCDDRLLVKPVPSAVKLMPHAKYEPPYDGAKEGLAAAHVFADVAMVSSANRDAVEEEWGKFGLLEHTDIVLAQDVGSKAACITEMLKFGYEKNHVLMVGDAPGDCDAAEKNGVWYYPILVNHEKASWDEAISTAFAKLQNGEYAEYEIQKKKEFLANLGG